jgi:uncharacterized protein YqeY
MEIKQKLAADLQEAMRNGRSVQKRNLRLVLTAIRLAEVEKGSSLDDAGVMAILQKEIKSRRETIEDARKAGREDIVTAAEEDITVLSSYLPQAISPDQLQEMVQAAIQEVGAVSPADMGKVMKVLMPRIQGRAPGDQVSQMVRQLLPKS